MVLGCRGEFVVVCAVALGLLMPCDDRLGVLVTGRGVVGARGKDALFGGATVSLAGGANAAWLAEAAPKPGTKAFV